MSLDRQAPLADLGEDAVVELLRRAFPSAAAEVGIGDDAAVFASPGSNLVFTTDTMVEGVDFELGYFSGSDLGWKAISINVSDVAAMGAEPSKAVVTLCAPPSTSAGFIEDLIHGLHTAAAFYGVDVVGGDISAAESVMVGVALLGRVDQPLLRSGARIGDAICVTGSLGGSAGGLYLLQRDHHARGSLVERHRRPLARIAEARRLRALNVSAMIDLSDGCVVDLERLLVASERGCRVEPEALPVDPALAELPELDAMEAALFGGEDFELLVTLAPSDVDAGRSSLETLGTSLTQIGVVSEGERRFGTRLLSEMKEGRWDHLRSR